jgi:hypothetical protein
MLYNIALFLHILGAIGYCITLAVIYVSVAGMRRAQTSGELATWTGIAGSRLTRLALGLSGLCLLVPGLYMVAVAWRGSLGWVLVAFAAYFVTGAAMGGFALRHIASVAQATRDLAHDAPLPTTLAAAAHNPLLWLVTNAVAGLLVGIVFLMTLKPDALVSVLVLVIALAAGLAIGRATSATRAFAGRTPAQSAV